MKLKPLPIVATIISVAFLAGAVAYNKEQMSPENQKPRGPAGQHSSAMEMNPELLKAQAPRVVVVEANANTYQALVKGYGEAEPRYAINYTAEVSGRVVSLSDKFEVGQLVKKGDVLAKLESISYQQAVAEAKSDYEQAKLDLLEEQRTGAQAKLAWKRSGMKGEPDSPLVLRAPQLAAAQAALENAKYSLQKARQDLSKTVIKAPFDALIVDQEIQPGSYVQTGTTVATLYSTDSVEVEIPLSAAQWKILPKTDNETLATEGANKWGVTLFSSDGSQSWQGYVTRVEQHVDSTSRQRSLVVAVDKPFEQEIGLFPGTFVQAEINGAVFDNTWKLPASAISQKGEIWFVTENDQLNKISADKLFERADSVYVTPMETVNATAAKIVKRPLSSYVVGMRVNATEG